MNFQLLNAKIVSLGITKTALAKKLGLSKNGLYLKLNGTNDFTRGEVEILCDVLQIDDLEEKEAIFFAPNVD